jgi:hypothetical protein
LVEHHLAKVDVESSSLFARSIFETLGKPGVSAFSSFAADEERVAKSGWRKFGRAEHWRNGESQSLVGPGALHSPHQSHVRGGFCLVSPKDREAFIADVTARVALSKRGEWGRLSQRELRGRIRVMRQP